MRELINACWFALKWGILAALVAAVGVGLYYYSRMNDEIRRRVEAKFAAGYPNLKVVVRSAQLLDGQGIEVRGVSICDPRLVGPPAELAYFDEILLCCETNLKELIQHEPKFTKIFIRRPRVQALRLSDGSWSASQLLPLPKFSDRPCEMVIEGGQLIVFDPQHDPPTTYNLHDVAANIKPLADERGGTGSLCEIHSSMAGDHLQRIEIAGRADRTSGAFDFTGSVAGIDISPELMAVLPPDYADRIKPLTPLRGQAGFGFHLHRDPSQPEPLQFELAGELASGRYDDARLPEALADLRAKFSADNRGFQITDLTSHNGKTTLEWNVRVNGFTAGAPILIEGNALHVRIGKNWEDILPPNFLDQWRKFLPEGEINVRNVRAEYDGVKWRLAATVQCLNVSFQYWKFPFRLESGQGDLVLDYDETTRQNRLKIDMKAFAGIRQVDINGLFFNPGPNFTGGVTLSGREMPFDQKLFTAIEAAQPKSAEVVRSLNPIGSFNFAVTTQRSDPMQQVMNRDVDIELNRCTFNYEKFPYPVREVTGHLKALDDNWYFQNLEGASHSGRITCQGDLLKTDDAGFALHLEFGGTNVALDDELRDALPTRMQPLWNSLRPRGSFNLQSAKVEYSTATKKLDVVTKVEPVAGSVSIEPTFFPYRLENLRGELQFHDDRAEFRNLRAVHGNQNINANGFCEREPDGSWHLHFENLTTDPSRLERDRDLLSALPPKLRKVVTQLNPAGWISMKGMLDLWGKPQNVGPDGACSGECTVRTAWRDMEFDIEQGTVHAGLDFQNIHGAVTLTGGYDPNQDGQKLMTRAFVNVDTLTWNQFMLSDIQGPLWIDDRRVLFGSLAEQPQPGKPPRRISARGYSGILEADGRVLLEETPRYEIQAAIDNVDLKKFCIDSPSMPGKQKVKGRLQAGVRLIGDASGLHTLAGDGQAQLRDADIYQLPVMVALLKVLNLKQPDTTAFTKCDATFHVAGEHIALKKIEFVGDAISLDGIGEMDLNTNIDLRLHSLLGRSDMQLDGWKKLMGGASEQIMQIQVTGTLADPHAKREPFPVLNQAFQSIQAGMQPERQIPPQGMRPAVGAGDASRR